MTPLIALEEHFLPRAASGHPDLQAAYQHFPPRLFDALLDVGDRRIADLDAGGVRLQVVSHGPGASSLPAEYVAAANDELKAAVDAHPRRLRGFAALPMGDPGAAAAELRRCVEQLGFLGAMVDCHLADGTYYDGEQYRPVWEQAEALDVPVYLHPTFPTPAVAAALYQGPWPPAVANALATSAWGWHADVGLHVLRLHAAGLFDRCPKLKLVVGHMGEMLPGMLDRIEQRAAWAQGLERGFAQVYRENLWITTSSFFSVDPMACIVRNTARDRILYSVDYPFSSHGAGLGFLAKLKGSGLVDDELYEAICYKNAAKLLNLDSDLIS